MSKSSRFQTKDERDEFLELWGVDFDSTDINGYDLTDYYESGKPITLEGWKKLVEDLNELFAVAPGQCEPVEAIDIPESPQVWTLKDVEDIREKMIEMCSDIEFDWGWYLEDWEGSGEDKDLLRFPFGREIIYEIVDQMSWCKCGADEFIIEENYPELGTCLPQALSGYDLEDTIGGMSVGPTGYVGYWRFYIVEHSTSGDERMESIREAWIASHPGESIPFFVGRDRNTTRLRQGSINCSGLIVYDDTPFLVPDKWAKHYKCYLDEECILATGPYSGLIWEEYYQAMYEQCLEYLAQKKQDAVDAAQADIDRYNANGEWDEYILVAITGIPSDECEES